MIILRQVSFLKCIGSVIRRSISTNPDLRNPRGYDDDGKTSVHILNKDEDLALMIDGYSQVGFKLNNRVTVLGPMVIFPRSVLSWNINDINDVNDDSLSLFKVLVPKLDIIVLGTGDKVTERDVFASFRKFSKDHKISFEILPTETACATFNFLNAEGRNVVGALIPPQTILHFTDDDIVKSSLRYDNPFVRN
ncbi:hypothetical protein ABEB36_008129 [Hypothenemus hampei]|uniref:NADH dehydrogenase [ubiquinone] 1 alpha subcomplex assembly factor 3 n=1 Tax=Hypothenemus hampei TaxID=57062 RepID=A0ABD1EKV4_HYPHA